MNFLHQVKSSIYDPVFYSELKNKPLGKSFKYYFELASVIALFTTIAFSIFILPKVQTFLGTFGETIVSGFPAELEVRLMDGKVTTNVTEPYIVPVPEDFVIEGESPEHENMLVINTKEDYSLEKFREYDSFALITEEMIILENGDGKISIESLNGVPNMTINRNTVSDWVSKTSPIVKAVPFLLPIIAFLAILIAYVFNLIYIAMVAVVVMFILKLKKIENTYKKSYQVVLHAMTLPILITFLFSMFGVGWFSFFPTFVLLVVVLVNFKKPVEQVISQ